MKAWSGIPRQGRPVAIVEVTPDLADKLPINVPSDRAILADVQKYRAELIDTCLEQDDAAMEAYLTDGSIPSAAVLRACLRKGTLNTSFNPVLCGSSYKNKGVQQVLDAVVDYLPAPTDVPSIKTVDADGEPIGERKCSDDEPFSALAFKVINDAYGALTFIRVYSGVRRRARRCRTPRAASGEIGRMVEMFARRPTRSKRRAPATSSRSCRSQTPRPVTRVRHEPPVVLERMRFRIRSSASR